jgi:hypothetical protein
MPPRQEEIALCGVASLAVIPRMTPKFGPDDAAVLDSTTDVLMQIKVPVISQ